MEGLIILVILYSLAQKIAEKVKSNRQAKVPTAPGPITQPESITQPAPIQIDEGIERQKQDNPESYNPQNPFGSWEDIFFPKQAEPVVIKPKVRPSVKRENQREFAKDLNPEKYNGISEVQLGKQQAQMQTKLSMDKNSIRQGILWSEVLGPPKSKLHWRNSKRIV